MIGTARTRQMTGLKNAAYHSYVPPKDAWTSLSGPTKAGIVRLLKLRTVLPEGWHPGDPIPDSGVSIPGEGGGRIAQTAKTKADPADTPERMIYSAGQRLTEHLQMAWVHGVFKSLEELRSTALGIAEGFAEPSRRIVEEWVESFTRGEDAEAKNTTARSRAV